MAQTTYITTQNSSPTFEDVTATGNVQVAGDLNVTGTIVGVATSVIQAITGDGAITIQNAWVVLSKASPAAITLAAPTAGTHDNIEIVITALNSQAHVITMEESVNNGGNPGTITFAGSGTSITLRAYNGDWWVTSYADVGWE